MGRYKRRTESLVDAAGTGQRCHPHRLCAGLQQGAGSCTRGGARGQNVVDQKNMFACNQRWGGYLERSTHIQTALARCQSCLGLGCAQPDESAGGKGQAPVGRSFAQRCKGFSRNQPRLIETAVSLLCAMQRNWNHQHLAGRFSRQLLDRAREDLAELTGSGAQAAVFECVDQVAHAAFIRPVGNSLHKGRGGEPAGTAQTGYVGTGRGRR